MKSSGTDSIHFSPKQQFVDPVLYQQALKNLPAELLADFDEYTNAVEAVYKHYQLPYPLYDYQAAWVNAFATKEAAGMYFEVGAGKTLTGIAACLYHKILEPKNVVIILMPPILLNQWQSELLRIPQIGKVQIYAGTPQARSKIDLNVDYLLVSIDIFKNDFERLYEHYREYPVTLLIDEATCIKNISTTNYKAVKAFYLQKPEIYRCHKLNKAKAKAKNKGKNTQQQDTQSANILKALLRDTYGT